MTRPVPLLSIFAITLTTGLSLAADPSDKAVKQMLSVGFDKQYSARAESDAIIHNYTAAHGVDRNMAHAYALALIKQGRYPNAEKPLRVVIALDAEATAPRRSLIRVLMLLKKHQAALIEAEELSNHLGKLPVEAKPTNDALKSAALLGRMVAYLEGPAPQPTLRNDLRKLIESTNLWPLELKREFELSQTDVSQLQLDIQTEIDKFQDKTEKELAEQKEVLTESVTERNEELKERQAEINERARKVQEEARAEFAALAAQEQPLAANYAELERRAILVRRELAPIVFDINQLLARADETEDPFERDRLLRRVDQLERIAIRYESDLAALGREAARLESQLFALRREQAIVQARFQGDQSRLASAQKGVQRGEKILQIDRRKLQRGLDAPTGGLRSLTRQLTAYTTYDAFDLAEQRQAILDSLGK